MCIELVKLLLLLSLIIAIACTCTNISHGHQQEVLYGPLPYSRLPYTPSKFWMFILPLTLGLRYFYLFCDNTIFAWSDTMTTIYFIAQFCVASIREWRLFNSVWKMKKSTASRKVEWLQTPGSQSEETLPCNGYQGQGIRPLCRCWRRQRWVGGERTCSRRLLLR